MLWGKWKDRLKVIWERVWWKDHQSITLKIKGVAEYVTCEAIESTNKIEWF
jgi:hypothetical protein